MSRSVQLILVVILILQIKHCLCDYVLQTAYQYSNKGKYGHPGGIIHAGLHALFTLFAFVVITPSLALGFAIVVGEFIVHYHIDWTKEQILKRRHWAFPQAQFWWVFGADQALHEATYLVIAAVLVSGAGL
ncbi:MAG TPA: DUF3307 domain-containing protein [Xanthobacteraceae bacterium]|nr:DUF3307 domain-containing protein [Xanthobacteraceae bacterium]